MKLQIHIYKRAWQLIITVIMLCMISVGFSCNPIKGLKKDLAAQTYTQGELAALCAEQFPNIPTIKEVPGKVDTAGLVAALIAQLCPEQLPIIIHDGTVVQVPAKPIDLKALIDSVKKHIAPDTTKRKEIDSALLKSLQYQVGVLTNQLAVAIKDRDTFKTNASDNKSLANKYFWMLIGLATVAGGVTVWKIYKAFNPTAAASSVAGNIVKDIKGI